MLPAGRESKMEVPAQSSLWRTDPHSYANNPANKKLDNVECVAQPAFRSILMRTAPAESLRQS